MEKQTYTAKINGREYPLFCSTEAYSEIGALCGGIEGLSEAVSVEKHSADSVIRTLAEITEILINGEIKRRNCAIDLGIEDGEKERLIPNGTILATAHPREITRNKAAIFNAIAGSLVYEIPDDVKIGKREIDEDLEEIREEQAKKAESAE